MTSTEQLVMRRGLHDEDEGWEERLFETDGDDPEDDDFEEDDEDEDDDGLDDDLDEDLDEDLDVDDEEM